MSCRSRPPHRPGHGWILGVAFPSTLASTRPASRGFTCVRCCSSLTASSPRALAVPRSCLWLTVASNGPCRGLAPPIDHSCPTHPVALRAPSVSGQNRKQPERENSAASRQRKQAKLLTDADHCLTLREPCVASLRSDRHQIGMTDRHHWNPQEVVDQGEHPPGSSPLPFRTTDPGTSTSPFPYRMSTPGSQPFS